MSGMLHDRVVLISGATGALGSAVVHEFAQTQAQLALIGRSEQKLTRLTTGVDLPAERVFTAAADVTQADGAEELLAAQGRPVGIGGYYQPDPATVTQQMRPSATFNAIIDAI